MRSAILAVFILTSAAGAADRPLADVIRANFDKWDRNSNGILSANEVDDLTMNPEVRGEAAAAVATLKLAMRARKPLKEFAFKDIERAFPKGTAGTVTYTAETDLPDGPDKLEPSYRAALKKIRSTRRPVFTDERPDITGFSQGPLGDCYFVSMVGALAFHNPEHIRDLIAVGDNGACDVTFPGKDPVSVRKLTDAQLAVSSSCRDGTWLPVMEHAFGVQLMRARNDNRRDEPTDIISRGGSVAGTIRILTNHDAKVIRFGAVGAREIESEKRAEASKTVRELLPTLLAAKRLVNASTESGAELPDGLTPRHAYAILAFDAEKSLVTVWNPHGNNFKPEGKPGIINGYSTVGGKFSVPFDEFIEVFSSMTYETDEPAPAPKPPKN